MQITINQAKIRRLINIGKTDHKIGQQLHIPRSVVKRIRNGDDINYYHTKSREIKAKKGMCECCKVRPKEPGNRFLCKWCSKNACNGEIYPECTIHGVL